VHVFLVFVKGLPNPYAQGVVHDAMDSISDVGKCFDGVFIRVSLFIDMGIETI